MPDMQIHPCEATGCITPVAFDDEPYCFVHSADSGSTVAGYSYAAQHPSAETLMREHGINI